MPYKYNPFTNNLDNVQDTSSFGDVSGPASSTDNAVARFDGTTGKAIQNSGVIIDDSDNITGVASIGLDDGTESLPSFYFTRSQDTGFYTDTNLEISCTVAGSAAFEITTQDIRAKNAVDGAMSIRHDAAGTASTPTYSFRNDADTGAFRKGTNQYAWATGGVEAGYFDGSQVLNLTNALNEANGGTGQSSYATGDVLYASSANTLSKLTAGSDGEVLTLASGVPTWGAAAAGIGGSTGATDNAILRADGTGGSTLQSSSAVITDAGEVHTGQGSTSSCALASTNDVDTGFYFPAANNINLVIGGVTKLAFQASTILAGSGVTGDIQINYGSAGTASSPVYAFRGDPNTGLYRGGLDICNIACGGSAAFGGDASQRLNTFSGRVKNRTATGISYNVLVTDEIVAATADGITLSLPASPAEGQIWYFKDESGAASGTGITIDTVSTETVDGAASVSINTNYGAVTIYSDGTNYFTL